jgi:hypothetical protein
VVPDQGSKIAKRRDSTLDAVPPAVVMLDGWWHGYMVRAAVAQAGMTTVDTETVIPEPSSFGLGLCDRRASPAVDPQRR